MQKQEKQQEVRVIDQFAYDAKKSLGQGSFATVYIGWKQSNPKELFAIKKIDRKQIQNNPTLTAHFMNQISVQRKLNNPNIVKFVKFLQSGTNYYVVQQHCDQGDLHKYIKNKEISENEAINIMKEILNGYLHMIKLGVIHRDLKPQNIFIKQGVFKIGDFGFAKNLYKSSIAKTYLGTPQYMSPQIIKFKPYTSKCDIWSLGIIFYQILFKKVPFNSTEKMLSPSAFKDLFNVEMQVTFPEDFKNQQIKDFIRRSLRFEQNDRITWKQIYTHPIFKGEFKDVKLLKKQINDELQKQNLFKLKIYDMDIPFQKLYSPQIFQKSKVTYQQFAEPLRKNNCVQKELKQFIFEKFQKDNRINLKKINNWLLDAQLYLNSKPQLNQKVSEVIKKINTRIKNQNLDLYQLFKNYDEEENQYLEQPQFNKLIDWSGAQGSPRTKKAVFQKFDSLHQKNISFNAFRSVLFSHKLQK